MAFNVGDAVSHPEYVAVIRDDEGRRWSPQAISKQGQEKMIATVYGEECRFCGEMCKEGFESDREHGVVYPAMVENINGTFLRDNEKRPVIISHSGASIKYVFCAYCGLDLLDKGELWSNSL